MEKVRWGVEAGDRRCQGTVEEDADRTVQYAEAETFVKNGAQEDNDKAEVPLELELAVGREEGSRWHVLAVDQSHSVAHLSKHKLSAVYSRHLSHSWPLAFGVSTVFRLSCGSSQAYGDGSFDGTGCTRYNLRIIILSRLCC